MNSLHRGDAEGAEKRAEGSQENTARPLGLYVHIPFCARKCPYCDFNTYAKLDDLFQSYVDALCIELEMWASRLGGRTIHTIFMGGGTPTVLTIAQLSQIFATIRRWHRLDPDCEITSEANPGAVDRSKFAALRGVGVNRLSMGVQSFDPDELAFLGRIHSAHEATRAYDAARSAGFTNINLDFIFGLPHQSLAAWLTTLERAIELAPEHLSLYSLIVEPQTPLYHWVQTGRVSAPDDDQAAEQYETAMARLSAAGYEHYEVSNWAKRMGLETGDWRLGNDVGVTSQSPVSSLQSPLLCRHNLLYWRNQEYIGVGPGAHSHLRLPFVHPTATSSAAAVGLRWSNCKPVPGYIRQVQAGETPVDFWEEIDSRTAMGETMMLGLRLLAEGVSRVRFRQRHGVEIDDIFADELARLKDLGMLHLNSERVRLTARGLMLGNQVFAAFLA